MKREALPLYLTPEQHRALRELSARTGRSMSASFESYCTATS